ADLPTLKQWVAEGIVLPTDKVRKGTLNWIEAQRAPSLRRVFAGEEIPEPLQEAAADTQHAHATLGEAHAALTETPAATPATHATHATHAQDLGLSAG